MKVFEKHVEYKPRRCTTASHLATARMKSKIVMWIQSRTDACIQIAYSYMTNIYKISWVMNEWGSVAEVDDLEREIFHLHMAVVTILHDRATLSGHARKPQRQKSLTVYMGTSGCGWNASFALHSRMVCSPPGSVSRKMPNLQSLLEPGRP